jgi:hypothetical protein
MKTAKVTILDEKVMRLLLLERTRIFATRYVFLRAFG